jgi:predicted nucleotide-binding protein (sugar kinase/HSP70/actin superfamily)
MAATNKYYIEFTEEMKDDYTILVPNMLPSHFKLICNFMNTYGYHMELLETEGPEITELGLRYVHNDACYPAILVIGQFLDALKSGKYDPHKTALIYFQTGGGCRASNYISLLRKALAKAGFDYVPVISFSFSDLEDHSGFKLSIKQLLGLLDAVLYGDLLWTLVNQTKPYEITAGEADALEDEWIRRLGDSIGSDSSLIMRHSKDISREIIRDFAKIPKEKRNAVKVGIVGEIYVKYAPLGNNRLVDFLNEEGAEVTTPGLLDFLTYCAYNGVVDKKFYGRGGLVFWGSKIAYKYLCKKKRGLIALLEEEGSFDAPCPFEHVVALNEGYISPGVKMGEGWLLTAEMLELADSGIKNIVCVQPFGCLPNHVCGKGMMRPIKERNPDINIVAVDYDPGASKVNQENRLKLMLSTARDRLS